MPTLNPNTGQVVVSTRTAQSPSQTLTLVITPGDGVALTADRVITITSGDADRGLTLSGDLTVEATSIVNQDLTTDAAVTFATLVADLSSSTAYEGTAVASTGEAGGTKFLREDGDGTCSWQAIAGGGDALTASPLSQFAATTSAQLAGVISDETGTGLLVFATSPTLTTPVLGTPTSGTLTNCTAPTSIITSGTFADARVAESNVTQHEAALTITESQISDLSHTVATLNAIGNVTITSIASGEILKWNGSAWINNTLAEAGVAAASHVHATTDITSGTLTDARVAESNVTQHEAALTITESQISDLSHTVATLAAIGNVTITSVASGELLKWNGSAWVNNTLAEANIAALGHLHTTAAVTSGTFADARISESSVTQHQTALSITESQISDLSHAIATVGSIGDVTITSIASGELLKWNGSAFINNTLAEAGISATGHGHTESDISDLGTAVAMVADNLSVFAATTSAQLAGIISNETGTGSLVFATSPTLVTPVLGTPTSGNLTNCTGYEGSAVLSTGEGGGSKFLREDGDGTSSWQAIPGGGDALTSSPLSQFAATTSAQLAGVISDETGTGLLVFATSPTLTTPVLGTPTSGTLTNCTGPTSMITSGTFTDARIAESNVTQHQTALSITESQISDLSHTVATFASIGDVTITSIASGEIPKWNGSAWINNTLAEAGIAAASHNHPASDITSGTLTVARGGTNSSTALTNNQIMVSSSGAIAEAGAMTDGELLIGGSAVSPAVGSITGGTGVTVTNGSNTIEVAIDQPLDTVDSPTFKALTLTQTTGVAPMTISSITVCTNLNADLLDGNHASAFATASHNHAASETTSGTFADARISESSVTQHKAALHTDIGWIDLADSIELTIATGAITATQSLHQIDTEGDASTDDLDTINGGSEGRILDLNPISNVRDVVLKHGTGNIQIQDGSDITMGLFRQRVTLIFQGSNWYVQANLY